MFYHAIYEELIGLKAGRDAILPLVEMDRNVIPALVQREVMTHTTWKNMDFDVPFARPTSPSLSPVAVGEQPSLSLNSGEPTNS